MADELAREQAISGLARADVAAGRVGRHARWMATYFTVFGLGFGAVTLILGLMQPLALRMTIFATCWPVLMIGMLLWARGQRAAPRGRFRGMRAWIATGILYGVVLVVGMPAFEGRVGYWVPAAVVIALPLCAAGWRERRT
jgi:peptidoglycan/LPS O-acetylase OafA/YrhL